MLVVLRSTLYVLGKFHWANQVDKFWQPELSTPCTLFITCLVMFIATLM